jgi:hypothetical protein
MNVDYIVELQTNDIIPKKSFPSVSDPGVMGNTLQLATHFNIQQQLGKCIKHMIKPYGPANNKQLQHTIYEVSDLTTISNELLTVTSSSNYHFGDVSKEDFLVKCGEKYSSTQDLRYITITHDNEADVYVTDISPSVKACFTRFNMLNILKTWGARYMLNKYKGIASPWTTMSTKQSLFTLKNDNLILCYDKYGDTIRVTIDDKVLPKDLKCSYPLMHGSIIRVEVQLYIEDVKWEELFTCRYGFLHSRVTDKNETSKKMKKFEDAKKELESARISLETNLNISRKLSRKFENNRKTFEKCQAQLESHLNKFESTSHRAIKDRFKVVDGKLITDFRCD